MATEIVKSGSLHWVGAGAAAATVLGPLLTYARIVAPMVGFTAFALGGIASLVGGVATLVRVGRGRGWTPGGTAALGSASAFLLAVLAGGDRSAPRINDFTSDLADPPSFANAGTIPENRGRDMSYPREFEDLQRQCCPDLAPVYLTLPASETFKLASRVASAMPRWELRREAPEAGVLEATETSRIFGFVDDIAIRVRDAGEGRTRVDMRSKSRDGKGDLGANANRIRAYLRALTQAANPPRG